jgi:hypothetical protein
MGLLHTAALDFSAGARYGAHLAALAALVPAQEREQRRVLEARHRDVLFRVRERALRARRAMRHGAGLGGSTRLQSSQSLSMLSSADGAEYESGSGAPPPAGALSGSGSAELSPSQRSYMQGYSFRGSASRHLSFSASQSGGWDAHSPARSASSPAPPPTRPPPTAHGDDGADAPDRAPPPLAQGSSRVEQLQHDMLRLPHRTLLRSFALALAPQRSMSFAPALSQSYSGHGASPVGGAGTSTASPKARANAPDRRTRLMQDDIRKHWASPKAVGRTALPPMRNVASPRSPTPPRRAKQLKPITVSQQASPVVKAQAKRRPMSPPRKKRLSKPR